MGRVLRTAEVAQNRTRTQPHTHARTHARTHTGIFPDVGQAKIWEKLCGSREKKEKREEGEQKKLCCKQWLPVRAHFPEFHSAAQISLRFPSLVKTSSSKHEQMHACLTLSSRQTLHTLDPMRVQHHPLYPDVSTCELMCAYVAPFPIELSFMRWHTCVMAEHG